ncbi:kinase-like domain-containing protein, partial [Ochromonadaceae sp. CCMP2298]
SLHHRSVVRSFDFIETPTSRFYVVMEQVQGGELFDRILKKKHYTEKEARDLVVVLVGHCHDNRIAHRDLKPENLLMTSKEDDADLKLVDFGFAARCEGNSLTNQCGTPAYVAPEIVRKQPHGVGVDMWSFGVILYILLCGYPPFRDKVGMLVWYYCSMVVR